MPSHPQEHLDQVVRIPTSYCGIADAPLEFVIQVFVALIPGNVCVYLWQEEGHTVQEVLLDGLLMAGSVVPR